MKTIASQAGLQCTINPTQIGIPCIIGPDKTIYFSGEATQHKSGSATILIFLGNGSIVVNDAISIDSLVVAGGGAGFVNTINFRGGGGGGGGGVVYSSSYILPPGNYPITVGQGAISNLTDFRGGSSFFYNSIAIGGGSGDGGTTGIGYISSSNGGSGGGSAGDLTPGLGIVGQGFAGGSGSLNVCAGGGGGGGGTGYAAGGIGFLCSITGNPIYYAGGGGGVNLTASIAPLGGLGGGGSGSCTGSFAKPEPGMNGYGGGGGGWGPTAVQTLNWSNGGSGVVIIRY